jgi:hypothetical protein
MVDAPGAARTARGALYLDTADGFGEWDILLSTRAVRDLRQTRRKAPDRFRVYLKKIKCVRVALFAVRMLMRVQQGALQWPVLRRQPKAVNGPGGGRGAHIRGEDDRRLQARRTSPHIPNSNPCLIPKSVSG